MKSLKIILTGVGCPGASTLIRMLRENGERKFFVVGVDMDEEASGRFLVDKFYRVPPGRSKEFIPFMLDLVEKEKPDILFPELTYEVYPLSLNRERFESLGTRVIVSDPEPIRIANNKYLMYEALKCKNLPLPTYFPAESYSEFLDAIEKLGYPEKRVVFKPYIGKGSRGVRIIDPYIDRKEQLMETKPVSKYMSLEEFCDIFENQVNFPQLLVMEYLDEENEGQRTTDCLCMKGKPLLTTVKTVEQARWGVIVRGELVEDLDLLMQTREVLEAIPLSYCVNLQFIARKLIEINPRVSSFIYQRDLNPPYLAIKLALGEINEKEIMSYSNRIDYGRRMVRYMDQFFHKEGEQVL